MRIGIINERPRETEVLLQAVALKPEHRVIWIGKSGRDAVELCAKETPDLILIGLLAGLDGVDATRRIMASAPCAILIVTGSLHVDAATVFEAMEHGALCVVEMPVPGAGTLQESAAPLLAKIATISRLIGERDAARRALAFCHNTSPALHSACLVAIGASARGSEAVAAVLRGLPRNIPAAIVVVQHLEVRFAVGMAEWLNGQSAVPVTVAREGEHPAIGSVLVAGTSGHLALKTADRVGYMPEPRRSSYRPSIDVFFHSVCRRWQGDAVGILLSGTGGDGVLGLKALRDRGHHAISEDQAGNAVCDMLEAAAALDTAVDILPLARIASRLIEVVVGHDQRLPLVTLMDRSRARGFPDASS